MSLARPRLQALKNGADIRKIGFPQEAVVHGDVFDFTFDAGPAGFEHR
jgi:hypothetical protein